MSQLSQIRFAYEQYLLDHHPTAATIFAQQVGQILDEYPTGEDDESVRA